jgi:hypothetical protein
VGVLSHLLIGALVMCHTDSAQPATIGESGAPSIWITLSSLTYTLWPQLPALSAITWVPNLAPRGAGKSPSQSLAFAPLRDHDKQLADEEGGHAILLGDQTLEALARSLSAMGGAAALDLDELVVCYGGSANTSAVAAATVAASSACGPGARGSTRASARRAARRTPSTCVSRARRS